MRQKRLNNLTLCIPLTSSCTMWVRCTGRSTRNGRKQLENARNSKKSVASIGYARSRWRAWEHLSFTLSVSLSLSHTICPLALALYQVLDRNCLKRSGAKKMSSMARKSQVERCFVIYNYDKKKILKSDHSLVFEIRGTKMLTNKRLKELAGWTPTSDEEQLSSKWKMVRKDQLEVGRDVRGEGLVERSTATKGSCSSEQEDDNSELWSECARRDFLTIFENWKRWRKAAVRSSTGKTTKRRKENTRQRGPGLKE